MDTNMNFTFHLGREKEYHEFKNLLESIYDNKLNNKHSKGIYIYGEAGIGKTIFVKNILNELNYTVIKYDSSDLRNKQLMENLTKNNMGDSNILCSFKQIKRRRIAIVMDEIESINIGYKKGINLLIKIIRPKKTKKQQLNTTDISLNPIICIGNNYIDKKIQELMKVCYVIRLKPPHPSHMISLAKELMPKLPPRVVESPIIQQDLNKLYIMCDMYNKCYNNNIISLNDDNTSLEEFMLMFDNIFYPKKNYQNIQYVVKNIMNNNWLIADHLNVINETNRTTVGLLWHENIINLLALENNHTAFPLYIQLLNNFCFCDYIDKVTFQKQIWQFNEMTSLIKTLYNNSLYHKYTIINPVIDNVRFTKVITKYNTEFNNYNFIQRLCFHYNMDKTELLQYFMGLQENNTIKEVLTKIQIKPKTRLIKEDIYNYYDNEIKEIDINRLYKYIDKLYGLSPKNKILKTIIKDKKTCKPNKTKNKSTYANF